ncbi:hypothetical protein Landi51_12168 [Colletotrichum acutatum]
MYGQVRIQAQFLDSLIRMTLSSHPAPSSSIPHKNERKLVAGSLFGVPGRIKYESLVGDDFAGNGNFDPIPKVTEPKARAPLRRVALVIINESVSWGNDQMPVGLFPSSSLTGGHTWSVQEEYTPSGSGGAAFDFWLSTADKVAP